MAFNVAHPASYSTAWNSSCVTARRVVSAAVEALWTRPFTANNCCSSGDLTWQGAHVLSKRDKVETNQPDHTPESFEKDGSSLKKKLGTSNGKLTSRSNSCGVADLAKSIRPFIVSRPGTLAGLNMLFIIAGSSRSGTAATLGRWTCLLIFN
jgi:hypothetical protein